MIAALATFFAVWFAGQAVLGASAGITATTSVASSVAAGIADGLRALERSTNSRFKSLKVSGGGIADANLIGELRQRLEYPLELVCQEAAVRGNLLNWYDTQTLRPLEPRYLSAVDCGNYLCSL